MFSDDELLRYSRQIMLQELDISGQEALHEATVLVVGLGGLGSPVALYLAAWAWGATSVLPWLRPWLLGAGRCPTTA